MGDLVDMIGSVRVISDFERDRGITTESLGEFRSGLLPKNKFLHLLLCQHRMMTLYYDR